MYFQQFRYNLFYIDSMDLLHEKNKNAMDLLHFGGKIISFSNKSLKILIWIRIFCYFNLKMLCESLKQKIVVFIMPLSW